MAALKKNRLKVNHRMQFPLRKKKCLLGHLGSLGRWKDVTEA